MTWTKWLKLSVVLIILIILFTLTFWNSSNTTSSNSSAVGVIILVLVFLLVLGILVRATSKKKLNVWGGISSIKIPSPNMSGFGNWFVGGWPVTKYFILGFLFVGMAVYLWRVGTDTKDNWNWDIDPASTPKTHMSIRSTINDRERAQQQEQYSPVPEEQDIIPIKENDVNHLEVGKKYSYFRDSRKLDVYLLEDATVKLRYEKEDDSNIFWEVTNVRRNGEPFVYFSGAPTNDVGQFIITTDKTIDVRINRY